MPYFIFGDREPFIGCVEELIVLLLGRNAGLKIWLDLHTAPDSQNGFDNGGIKRCVQVSESEEVEFELTVLERWLSDTAREKGCGD